VDLKHIYIEATTKTPHIDMNPMTGEFIFSGKSIPENPAKIYESLVTWMQDYAKNPRKTTNLRLNIEYFNTASVIWLAKIIKALCSMEESENTLFIHLYFDIEEFDSMETEDLKETLSPVLDMVGTPSINLGIKLYGTGENGEVMKETMVLI